MQADWPKFTSREHHQVDGRNRNLDGLGKWQQIDLGEQALNRNGGNCECGPGY